MTSRLFCYAAFRCNFEDLISIFIVTWYNKKCIIHMFTVLDTTAC